MIPDRSLELLRAVLVLLPFALLFYAIGWADGRKRRDLSVRWGRRALRRKWL